MMAAQPIHTSQYAVSSLTPVSGVEEVFFSAGGVLPVLGSSCFGAGVVTAVGVGCGEGVIVGAAGVGVGVTLGVGEGDWLVCTGDVLGLAAALSVMVIRKGVITLYPAAVLFLTLPVCRTR